MMGWLLLPGPSGPRSAIEGLWWTPQSCHGKDCLSEGQICIVAWKDEASACRSAFTICMCM